MQRDPHAYLWDIRNAAEAIQGFLFGLDAQASLPGLKAAVSRLLDELGPAAS
jgi:hypothetical protein